MDNADYLAPFQCTFRPNFEKKKLLGKHPQSQHHSGVYISEVSIRGQGCAVHPGFLEEAVLEEDAEEVLLLIMAPGLCNTAESHYTFTYLSPLLST